MNDKDFIQRIKDVVFSVPYEMYKFPKPKNCFKVEWEDANPKEKAFLLIYDLLLEKNKEQTQNKEHEDNVSQIKLGRGPRFLSQADENMFFQAIYSMPSFVQIVGEGLDLNLFYKDTISSNEVEFLLNLFRRYQMTISSDFIKFSEARIF